MINNQNCFAANFGYNGEVSIPTISLAIIRQNMTQHELKDSYKCFFIFVGGKYVEEMKIILDRVKEITDQFHGIKPIAMFVIGKFNAFEIGSFSSHSLELTKVICLTTLNTYDK